MSSREIPDQTIAAIELTADSCRQRRVIAFDPKTGRIAREAPPRLGFERIGENYPEKLPWEKFCSS